LVNWHPISGDNAFPRVAEAAVRASSSFSGDNLNVIGSLAESFVLSAPAGAL